MSHEKPLNLADVTISELRHRVKNLVAITQALVSQTLRETAEISAAASAIEQRLNAVAKSVDVMLRTDWGPVDLDELVNLAVVHAPSFPGRLIVGGPRVVVKADWATMLILALQELETNALKHGALSGDRGTVELTWSIVDAPDGMRSLWLQWTERGGPPSDKPGRRGSERVLPLRFSNGTSADGPNSISFRPG